MQMLALPGVGPSSVEKIVNIRKAFGHVTMEHLQSIKRLRITQEMMEKLDFSPCEPHRHGGEDESEESDDDGSHSASTQIRSTGSSLMSQPQIHTTPAAQQQTPPLAAQPPMPYFYPPYMPPPTQGYYGQPSAPWYPPPPQPYASPLAPANTLPTSAKSKNNSSGNIPSKRDVKMPNTIAYNGSSKWKSFFKKFCTFADEQGWDARERKNHLCYCLDGKASDFYASITEKDPDLEYFDLVSKMERRFDFQDLPETVQMQFQFAKQKPEESVVEWAERVMTMASRAFDDMSEKHLQKQMVFKFCQGLLDKEAGQYAINIRVETVDAALDKVKWYQHTHKIMHPKQPSRSVYQVDHDSEEEYGIYATGTRPPRQYGYPRPQQRVRFEDAKSDVDKKPDKLENRVSSLEEKMQNLSLVMEKGFNDLRRMTSYRQRSRSPSPRGACFQCGEQGHFKRDCPKGREQVKSETLGETRSLNM